MSSDADRVFTPFVLENSWIVEFPAEPGGVLRLGPGRVSLEASFGFRYRAEEGCYDVVETRLRLADADGRLWQATSLFMSGALLSPILDLARPEPACWLRNAPPAWTDALERRMMLEGISEINDDRIYRHFWLDNSGFCWQFKYFGMQFALAPLDDSTLLVRVSDAYCHWNPATAMGPDGPLPIPPRRPPLDYEDKEAMERHDEEMERQHQEGEYGDSDEMPPLTYPLEAGRLLFRNTAWSNEEEGWRAGETSRPLVFRPTDLTGPPQKHVTHHPGARLAACPSPGGDDGFVLMSEQWGEETEFATDAGGRLVARGGAGFRVKLEKHPGGAGEVLDVLRKRVRLTDDRGAIWECVTHCTPEAFFEGLVDLVDIGTVAVGDWEQPPGPEAVLGIRAVLDDGAWRVALSQEHLIAFRGRDQRPLVDMIPHSGGFAARITGLEGRRRAVGIGRYDVQLDPESREQDAKAWEADHPLPPLRCNVPLARLAFRNTTFAIDDGFWHRNAIPIPVVFTRVGSGPPDAKVRFVAEQAR
jgi:hypothetical protein